MDFLKLSNITEDDDLSLQKYILQVNGETINEDRSNRYIEDNSEKIPYYNDNDTPDDISDDDNYMQTDVANYKYNKPVEVKAEQTVTYQIKLYNNGKNQISGRNIVLTDEMPEGFTEDDIVSIHRYNPLHNMTNSALYEQYSNELEKDKADTYKYEVNENKITIIDNGEINPGRYNNITYEITLRIPSRFASTNRLENKAYIDKGWSDKYRTEDADYINVPKVEYNISLQKYITKVGTTEITGRRNRVCNDDVNENGIYYNKSNESVVTSNGNTKYSEPVPINVGDWVEYTIEVYNNSETEIGNVIIEEIIPNNVDKYKIKYNGNESNETLVREGINQFSYAIDKIGAYDFSTVKVMFHFNEFSTEIIENKVKIAQSMQEYTSNYRKEDSDYIKMNKNVSLQKYIVKVNDEDLTTENTELIDRNNTKNAQTDRNVAAALGNARDNLYKKENPVEIELGDWVEYKIVVYNNLSSTADNIIIQEVIPDCVDKYIIDNGAEKNVETDGKTVNITIDSIDANGTKEISVKCHFGTYSQSKLGNTVKIISTDNYTEYRTEDQDYVKMKEYAVSLEKYVSAVNGKELSGTNSNISQREGKAEHGYDNDETTVDNWKSNNIVTVKRGDIVTYTIKVTNDSENASVYITEVKDYLPDGVKYNGVEYNGGQYNTITDNEIVFNAPRLLGPKESANITIAVEIIENDMSLNILKNTARITEIKNINEIVFEDTTPNNNEDSDYLQLNPGGDDNRYAIIAGTVWNDITLDKQQNNYNAQSDETETKISGIKVYLYRVDKGIVAVKETDSNGYYSFADADIDPTRVTNGWERYIKGPKVENTNRWAGTYYSYYIVFEYDGITYTSTPDGTSMEDIIDSNKDYKLDSNAKEDNNIDGLRTVTREEFNASINPNSGTNYYTVNEEGYIPQSIHTAEKKIHACTNLISFESLFANTTDIDEINLKSDKLKYVGLGLRGRDIFDLELISDVNNIKVTVNGQGVDYKYSNKVNLRQKDLTPEEVTTEDMANIKSEGSNVYVDKQYQNIRNSDFNVDTSRYGAEQGISNIEVTYKITVHNTSSTNGTATKIINYYDNKYTINTSQTVKGYYYNYDSDNQLKRNNLTDITLTNGTESGTNYNSVIATIPETMLGQAEKIEIYLVYTLQTPVTSTLAGITTSNSIPTFNMVEIAEYKIAVTENKYTRALLDKDSAPGSANKEQVRLTTTEGQNTITVGGNPSTVGYYFGGNDLSKLKYEDDTYATPTLYFVIKDDSTDPDNPDDVSAYNRTITGIVFEDKTSVNSSKVRTGNGKLDTGEVGVFGATVELIEVDETGNNPITRFTTITNKGGKFKFENFLPGYYIIRYHYGDTTETVLLNQKESGINGKSYNGEDFQATNNIGTNGARKLNETENFWYLYNETEGISTAKDDITRRGEVSSNVTDFTDEQMTVLNNVRAGKTEDESKVIYLDNAGNTKEITVGNIINDTKMNATTPKMLFTVEKTEIKDDQPIQRESFGAYIISNMNFGIAEVPVTRINLQKSVKSFVITDSTGNNVIAKVEKIGDEWKIDGDVYVLDKAFDVSIEEEKLQGARLQVTYDIISKIEVEKNFDNTSPTVVATIEGLVDYIDNNLSYNPNLGDNIRNWEVTTYNEIKETFATNQYKEGTIPQGVLDPEGKEYNVVVKATDDNPILNTTDATSVPITLERVLSSTDATLEEIVTSTVETFTYGNTVEITKLNYGNTVLDGSEDPVNPGGEENPVDPGGANPGGGGNPGGNGTLVVQRDRIRTPDRYIIIPGVQYDTAASQTIIIHPPTGASGISTIYYIIAAIALAVISVGIFGIKKFVIKK